MRIFETIRLGGVDWCIWGRTKDQVNLCTAKSVFNCSISENEDAYHAIAKYEDSVIDHKLNSSFIKKLTNHGLSRDDIDGNITIFDADTVLRIHSMGFVFPPVTEGKWWLKSQMISKSDAAVINYMMQADNNGEFLKECAVFPAGIRAVMTVRRTALSSEQEYVVKSAQVAVDLDDGEYIVEEFSDNVRSKYRRRFSDNSDEILYRTKYSVVICPKEVLGETDLLYLEVKEACNNVQKICTIPDCLVDTVTVNPEFVFINVDISTNASISDVVNNIKSNIVPISLREDRNFFDKILNKTPDFWRGCYLVSTDELDMTAVRDYVEHSLDLYKQTKK